MLRRLIPVLAMVALAGSGCTGDPAPAPTPPTTPTPTTTTTTSTSPSTTETPRPTIAPPVTEPVDLRPLREHACAVLTRAQQRQIGFRQYDQVAPEGANSQYSSCRWLEKPKAGTNNGYGYRIGIYLSGDPLAEAYADSNARDGYDWDSFEARQIGGLPAVVRSLLTPDDDCSVVVGTGNGQGIEINGTVDPSDPTLCDRFVKAAEWIVDKARA